MPSLTEGHRLAQVRIGAETITLLASIWSLIDLEDITGSAPRWLRVAEPIVQAQRARSARLAAGYLEAFREAETGEKFSPVLAGDAPAEQVTTALLVTGVYHLLSNRGRGIALPRAAATARASSSAAAMRLALNGGRETLLASVKADPRARGYQRVTSGNACGFCSMLADRGAVYSVDTGDFEAHDHCSCMAEPVYQ